MATHPKFKFYRGGRKKGMGGKGRGKEENEWK